MRSFYCGDGDVVKTIRRTHMFGLQSTDIPLIEFTSGATNVVILPVEISGYRTLDCLAYNRGDSNISQVTIQVAMDPIDSLADTSVNNWITVATKATLTTGTAAIFFSGLFINGCKYLRVLAACDTPSNVNGKFDFVIGGIS